ncbi:MAG: hydantoinase B/oxoprolinase family protein [Rhodospirillales bacterium]
MAVDPITVQIIKNKVASLVDEMHYHFYRSGYSTIIRESRDFSCVILDKDGRLIVPPPMFFHAPFYKHFVDRTIAIHGLDNLRGGDVIVSNHPYEAGVPHVSDMAFIAPIFAGGVLVGYSGSCAHKADIGGTNPGSTSANSTEIFHEGLLLPPVKITRGGEYNHDIERMILANSRQPDLVRGDVRAQIAATEMGVQRMTGHCQRFGTETVMDAFAAILGAAAEEMRAAIAALPDGEASADGYMDDDGIDLDKPIYFAVTITKKDDAITFDFSESQEQARGPINLRPSMVEACVFYSLIGCLGPEMQFNDGMRDVVTFKYAPRTITNAEAPAPVSSYQKANLRLTDVILTALASFNPARAIAGSGSSGSLSINWHQGGRQGHNSLQYEILGSAYGGGAGNDGCNATATHLSNLHVTSIEIIESEYPCRITEFDMVTDSGGAGEFRGGVSFRRRYEVGQDCTVVRRYDRRKFPPPGADGGADGGASKFVIRAGTAEEEETPAAGKFELKAGEVFYLESAGGGGFGDPRQRAAERLARDLEEGYVSQKAAKELYGR